MGQVVPKDHIAMVYEQSKHPNADTILQGLLGRMCGYQAKGAHRGVDIYVSPMAEDLIRKYSRAWQEGIMDELSTITRAMNLGGVKRKNGGAIVQDKDGNKHIKTVPIKFSFSMIERDNGDSVTKFRSITSNDLKNLFEDHPELIEDNPDIEVS